MATWAEIRAAAPKLVAAAQKRFKAHKHLTMATLRSDGSPRISGTELVIKNGELWLGGMPGSLKCRDLQRDPRVAVHSGSDDPATWTADAKIAGRAIEVTDDATKNAIVPSKDRPPGEFHLFRLDVTELVVTGIGKPADHLVVESWHEGRGVERVERR